MEPKSGNEGAATGRDLDDRRPIIGRGSVHDRFAGPGNIERIKEFRV
jgi:hypothetical protein